MCCLSPPFRHPLLTHVALTHTHTCRAALRCAALYCCRYGALKSLGEKKTAFNEYVQQRKKEEAEEARQRRMQVGGAGRCMIACWVLGRLGLHALALALPLCTTRYLHSVAPHPALNPLPGARQGGRLCCAVCASTCLAPAPCSPLLHLCMRIVLAPQAKEGFYALLDDSAELRGAPGRPKFSRARDLLELEPRWQVRRAVLRGCTACTSVACWHACMTCWSWSRGGG
jgi:hypothetical protein